MLTIPGTWQQVLITTLLILIILGALWCSAQRLLIRARERRALEPRQWPVVDYSLAYEEKRRWLGDRFLFARPINRRLTPISERESIAILRRVDHARLGF